MGGGRPGIIWLTEIEIARLADLGIVVLNFTIHGSNCINCIKDFVTQVQVTQTKITPFGLKALQTDIPLFFFVFFFFCK